MRISQKARNALYIGCMCSVSYLSVYFVRNILGAVTPQMLEQGVYTNEYIGKIESVYLICYAFGQLINGAIGDRVRARYMISAGLLLSGICCVGFAYVSDFPALLLILYGGMGIFLSMIYGPLNKSVAENTEMPYTPRCNLGFTVATFFGAPLAGVVAAFFSWQNAFWLGSLSLIGMSVLVYVFFTVFEKRGLICYGQFKSPEKSERSRGGVLRMLWKRQIVRYSIVSMITGIVRTSVVFWLPTYMVQHLGYTSERAAMIFTVGTFITGFMPFLTIFIYERLHHNMELSILLFFSVSSLLFFSVFFVENAVLNLILLFCAVMTCGGCTTMLYSRYCTGLRDTGMVSGVTGWIEFVCYMASAASSTLFANAVTHIGWQNLILIWTGIVFIGVLLFLPYRKLLGKRRVEQE